MDGGAWWAAVHGVAKSQTRLVGLWEEKPQFPLLQNQSFRVRTLKFQKHVCFLNCQERYFIRHY